MSLILEALKKSESRRRLGEAPDLGTPFTVARRRRNPLPLIALAIIAAGAFGWWYLRTPTTTADTRPATASAPQPAAPPANPAAPQRTPGAVTPTRTMAAPPFAAGANPAAANRMQPGSVLDGNPSQPTPPGLAAMRAANRSGNQTVPAPPATAPVAAPATALTPKPAGPAPAAPAPSVATANRATPAPATNPPAPATAPAPPPSVVASGPGTQKIDPNAAAKPGPDVAAAPANAAPAGPPLPLYYELPYSTRKDIPPIVLSMHVFSPDMATRFVVVDGERKAQGESLKEGLKLDEIRPDGMVLEFRGQRFFYPRSGH